MLHVVALFAGCLLHPVANNPCHAARATQYEFIQRHAAGELVWNDNGTVKSLKTKGVVLKTGITGFQVGQPAAELLEKLGPALLATGTEELRVAHVHRDAPKLKPDSPERSIRFDQFIRGRQVRTGSVKITFNIQTNEVMAFGADFLPDRGLDHKPKLTEDRARAKAEILMRKSPFAGAVVTFSDETAPYLAYAFEELGEFGVVGGALVWVFQAKTEWDEWTEVNISAATGESIPRYSLSSYWYMREVPTPIQ